MTKNLSLAKSEFGQNQSFTYSLSIDEFAESFVEIPTSNVTVPSSTVSSKYLAGRAPVYNANNERVGNCSASFLCMQNESGIYTDITAQGCAVPACLMRVNS